MFIWRYYLFKIAVDDGLVVIIFLSYNEWQNVLPEVLPLSSFVTIQS